MPWKCLHLSKKLKKKLTITNSDAGVCNLLYAYQVKEDGLSA